MFTTSAPAFFAKAELSMEPYQQPVLDSNFVLEILLKPVLRSKKLFSSFKQVKQL